VVASIGSGRAFVARCARGKSRGQRAAAQENELFHVSQRASVVAAVMRVNGAARVIA
jgi:hypothetical protein